MQRYDTEGTMLFDEGMTPMDENMILHPDIGPVVNVDVGPQQQMHMHHQGQQLLLPPAPQTIQVHPMMAMAVQQHMHQPDVTAMMNAAVLGEEMDEDFGDESETMGVD